MPEKKKKPLKKAHFEVLLEDIDAKFALVLEGHDVLNKKIDNLSAETKERDDHLEFLIHAVNGKIDKEATAIRGELKETKQELIEKIDKEVGMARSDLKQEIGAVRSELKEEIGTVRNELKEDIGTVRSELQETKKELGEKIDKVLEKVEDHETRIVRLEEKVLS